MKKIGIITITSGFNFGNKLQNYALQMFIEREYNCICETLINKSVTFKYLIKKKFFYKKNNYNLKNDFFNAFVKNNIKVSDIEIGNFKRNKKIKKYDCLICGSDQIWNSFFAENDRANFGYFYKGQKVSSYAASFGVNCIKNSKIKKYSKYLKNMQYISVREDRAKEMVEELTGRKDIEVLVDPTMLLTSNEWDKIAKKPKKLKTEKYILNYFLGELSESRKKEIERIAKENDLEIINILDKNDPLYVSGPSEFLYLEKNATLICTDSFHSSVFAILYNRPFVIFDREQKGIKNMNSRIDTLISKFNLKNRRYNGKNITKENLEHNYTEAYKVLEEEREKSKRFLEKALDIEK